MKKKLDRALLKKARSNTVQSDRAVENTETVAPREPRTEQMSSPTIGGAGSAWKAGAAEQNRTALAENREKTAADIMSGKYVIELDTSNVHDRLGTDRREDWADQEAQKELYESIETNGQDTPIHVWPSDPQWKPDRIDPTNVDGVDFDLIVGRRRHAIAHSLGRKVLAILAPQKARGETEEQFEQLFMRFRENEERENLGPFERLCAIGEMFEELLQNHTGEPPTAVSFAKRINVHESVISRGRAVFRARDAILNKFKTVYEMSYPELQRAVSTLNESSAASKDKKAKPKKINVTKKVGSRNLSLTSQAGKLSISTSGLQLNKGDLDKLGELIADHLNKLRSK